MKGLAFAYDPDGYWIELVSRNKEAGHPETYNLGQTMLRIKDVDKSLDFYTGEGGMGMTKVSKRLWLLRTEAPEGTGLILYCRFSSRDRSSEILGTTWFLHVSSRERSTQWPDEIYDRHIMIYWMIYSVNKSASVRCVEHSYASEIRGGGVSR